MWTDRLDEKLAAVGRRTPVYLFAIAIAMHLCYLAQYARTPFFWVPELDSLYDDLAAQSIAAGHGTHDPFFRAPGYLYFLAGIYKVFGHSYWAARLIQAVIGSASVVLLYLLGARLFRPSIAVVAAVGMALYGPLVYNDGELHTPVLEVFLDLAMLNVVVEALREKDRKRLWGAAGLLLGLSAVTRPSVLVVIPVVVWWIAKDVRARRSMFVAAAAFAVGAAIFPTLVTVQNWRVSGDPVFIASQGGINLYLGNRPNADGFTPSTPTRYRFDDEYEDSVQLYGQKAAEEAEGRRLSASEAQSYWVHRSLDWWRTAPEAAVLLTVKKVALAWTHSEIRNNTAYAFARRELAPFLWICCVGFWIAGPLSIVGMVLGRRDTWVRRLTTFTLVYMAGFVPFFMADRYRLPVVPLLLLLGSYGVAKVSESVAVRQWQPLRVATAALLIGVILVNVNWVRTSTAKTWAIDYWSMGNRYTRQGKFAEAEGAYRKAVALDARNGDYWNGLGEALYGEGRLVDAAQAFNLAAVVGPDVSRGLYNQAICETQLGDAKKAVELLTLAVKDDPGYDKARVKLTELLRE